MCDGLLDGHSSNIPLQSHKIWFINTSDSFIPAVILNTLKLTVYISFATHVLSDWIAAVLHLSN